MVMDLKQRLSTDTRPVSKSTVVKHRSTYLSLGLVVILLNLYGLVMVLSASSVQSLQQTDGASSWFYFQRQSFWMFAGVLIFLVTVRVPYRVWAMAAPALLVVNLAAMLLVPIIGIERYGARRWLEFGPIRLQPAEFLKFTLLIFVAAMLAKRERQIGDYRRSLNTVVVLMIPIVFMLMKQPDFGSTLIIAAIVFAALFVAGVPLRPIALLAVGGLGLGIIGSLTTSYRLDRITAFLDPGSDPDGTSYQIVQSKMSLASGQLFGSGLGQGHAKWGYLPNAHTDFIFAVVGEELGLFGATVMLGLFVALGLLGYVTAMRSPDLLGTVLATGITAGFLFQAFVNIGGVVGLLPITGLTLPFVSSGGSSLLVTMASAGVLMNIARHAR